VPGATGSRRRFTTAASVLYAVFLLVSPFGHHDLQCELRTPLHCTMCAATAVGSDPQTAVGLGTWHLDDAGRAVTLLVVSRGFLLDVRINGRSPPPAFA
jgi:hypothetical protein